MHLAKQRRLTSLIIPIAAVRPYPEVHTNKGEPLVNRSKTCGVVHGMLKPRLHLLISTYKINWSVVVPCLL